MIRKYIKCRRIGKEIGAFREVENLLKSNYYALVINAAGNLNEQKFFDMFYQLFESKYIEEAKELWMNINSIESQKDAEKVSVICRNLRIKMEQEIPFYYKGLLLNLRGNIIYVTYLEGFVFPLIVFIILKFIL